MNKVEVEVEVEVEVGKVSFDSYNFRTTRLSAGKSEHMKSF